MHKSTGQDDAPLLTDHAIDLAGNRKCHQLVGMVVQLRACACTFDVDPEIHVLPLNHRALTGGEVWIEMMALQLIQSVKRHGRLQAGLVLCDSLAHDFGV